MRNKYLAFAAICWASQASADVFLFDDFDRAPSLEKYSAVEETVRLDTVNENVVFRTSGRAYTWNGRSNWLVTSENEVSQMQAEVTLTELELANPATQTAATRLCGTFYNSTADEPDNQLGDVFACIILGDKGFGPEAWWVVMESTDEDFGSGNIQVGILGSINLNTPYTLNMAWDGDNTFAFTLDNGTAVNVDGPVNLGGASASFRGIGQRLGFAIDNSQQFGEFVWSEDLEVRDDGSAANIVATVDDVVTEFGLIDDFSGPVLDQAVWEQYSTSSERTDGKLEMRVNGVGNLEREDLILRSREIGSLGAGVTLLSSGTVNDTTRVRGRISLALANDTYDLTAGDTANGFEGTIWTQFLIERAGGVNRAVVYAERAANAAWTIGDELFRIVLPNPIALDQEYDLLIEKTGTRFEYLLDGNVVHSVDLATEHSDVLSGNLYEVTYDHHAALQVRVDDDAGEARVRFDDVVTDIPPTALAVNAFNAADTQVDLPARVIANEGEIIDLVAGVSDPVDVVAYLWEQTSGPDVDVGAPRPRAARAIGSESNLSFTVPAGSDGQDLGFRVTVVNQAGMDSAEEFVVSVDNGADSTLGTDFSGAEDEDDDDEDGGSSLGPIVLIAGILLCAIAVRRRGS